MNMKRKYDDATTCHQPKRMKIFMSSLPDRMLKTAVTTQEVSPDTTVASLSAHKVDFQSYAAVQEKFFHAPTQAEIDAYDHDFFRAQDVAPQPLSKVNGRLSAYSATP